MRKEVKVDLSGLLKDTSSSKYPKGFGIDDITLRGDMNGIRYTLVTDEGARFINLFGLSVEVDSGDIALGYFPSKDSYIKIGNIFDGIRVAMFGKSKDTPFNSEDYRYILECLKVNPKFRASHTDDLEEIVKEKDIKLPYKSIILNLIASRSNKQYSKSFQNFLRGSGADGRWVTSLIKDCVSISLSLENVARDYFWNFISESNTQEILDNSKLSVVELLESRKPNLESLMLKYLSYGIPIEFLTAMKSYGFGSKQRKACFPGGGKSLKYELSRMSDSVLLNIGECLSSLSYVDGGAQFPSMVKTYNIMDLMRAINVETEVLFSLEILKDGNGSLYSGISKKFNFDDLLLDSQLTEKDFIVYMDKYQGRFLSLVDRGSVYSRNVSFGQYSFLSFGGRMIESSGMVFQRAISKVLKKF